MSRIANSAGSSRCIIHVGMHKTGSTSIQRNLDGFRDNRFVYANLGNLGNHSLPIYSLFARRPERHHLHQAAGFKADAVQKYNRSTQKMLARTISDARGQTLLISGEDIGALPEHDLVKLRDYFQAHFGELMIVAYVRPPAGFMTSSFQQRVKNGLLKTFNPAQVYRNYQASFGKLDRVFGRHRVHLWKFDPSTFPAGDVVRHFCASLGILRAENKVVRTNESLSGPAIAALYAYNKFRNPKGLNIADALGEKISARLFQGKKFRFSPDLIGSILARHRTDIEWMETRLGHSLAEELGDSQLGDVATETDLLRQDPELVARLVAELGNAAPVAVKGETPIEVAELIEALRVRNASRSGWIGWRAPYIIVRRLADVAGLSR